MNKDDDKNRKTEWDLRQSEIEILGDYIQEKSLAYRELIKNKNKENLKNFFQELQISFKELRQFADPRNEEHKELCKEINEEIKEIREDLPDKQGIDSYYEVNVMKQFKRLDKLDDKIRQLQMAVGLSIPMKTEREGYGATDKMKGDKDSD